MTDSEKIERILRLCEGIANTLVEHSVELKFLHTQVEIHSEDLTSLSSRLRDAKVAVEQLTKIAEGHESRLRSDRESIHDLQRAEERRVAAGDSTPAGE